MTAIPTYVSLLIISMIAISSLQLRAQSVWERVDETPQGPINNVEIESVLFASDGTPIVIAGNGIYRVEERIVADAPMRVGIKVLDATALRGIRSWSTNLYVFNHAALYGSTDDGRTWQDLLPTSTASFISPPFEAGGHLVVPNRSSGYVRELDVYSSGGELLRTVKLKFSSNSIVAVPSGRMYALDVSSPRQIRYSDDLGLSWGTLFFDPGTNYGYRELRSLADSLLLLQVGSSFNVSKDAGLSWSRMTFDSLDYPILSTATIDGSGRIGILNKRQDRDEDYETPVASVLISRDSGMTWQRECGRVYRWLLDASTDGIFYAQDSGQLVFTASCGAPWEPIPFGFRNVPVTDITASPDGRFYATIRANGPANAPPFESSRHYRSDDDGRTWHTIAHLSSSALFVDSSGNVYIERDSLAQDRSTPYPVEFTYKNLIRSSDGGRTWHDVFDEDFRLPGSFGPEPLFNLKSGPDGIVVVTLPRFNTDLRDWRIEGYQSTDGGATFSRSPAWPEGHFYSNLGLSYNRFTYTLSAEGWIIARMSDSSDGTYRYPARSILLYHPLTNETIVREAPPCYAVTHGKGNRLLIWSNATAHRSEDQGVSWEELTPLPPHPFIKQLVESADGAIWLADRDTLYRSGDRGRSWSPVIRMASWSDPDRWKLTDSRVPEIVLEDGTIIDMARLDAPSPEQTSEPFLPHNLPAVSSDGGETWEYDTDSTFYLKGVRTIARGPNGTILVGTSGDGIYRLAAPVGEVQHEARRSPHTLDLTGARACCQSARASQ